jgi:soluble lytic murein transglycosylase-like protein
MIRKAVVCTITIVFLLCPQVKANQQSVSNVKESIVKHSLELGIDPALALSIAKSESGFRHEARSSHGAIGVFQLMPSTAKRLGINPYYLSDNIKGGLMYYKKLYTMFGSTELALAAYNAGPGVVKKYKKVPPIGETKRFVSGIMSEYNRQKSNPDPVITKAKNSSKKVGPVINKPVTEIELTQKTAPTPVQEPILEEIPLQGII